jgi:hypothetical protein
LNPFYGEARATLDDLLSKAVAAYQAGTPDACPTWWAWGTVLQSGSCCPFTSLEPPAAPTLCPVDPAAWASPPWSDLGFAVSTPTAFVVTIGAWTEESGTSRIEATAYGDLDCDGQQSTFRRFARTESTPDGCKATIVPGLFTSAETE